MDRYSRLDGVLVSLFNDIIDIESRAIVESDFSDITNNDMHVIDTIGIGVKKNMSTVVAQLSITIGSLTTAINALVRKGYVNRERGIEDKRLVYIELSEKGKLAFMKHREFHQKMLSSMIDGLSDHEVKLVTDALFKVHEWLVKTYPKK